MTLAHDQLLSCVQESSGGTRKEGLRTCPSLGSGRESSTNEHSSGICGTSYGVTHCSTVPASVRPVRQQAAGSREEEVRSEQVEVCRTAGHNQHLCWWVWHVGVSFECLEKCTYYYALLLLHTPPTLIHIHCKHTHTHAHMHTHSYTYTANTHTYVQTSSCLRHVVMSFTGD